MLRARRPPGSPRCSRPSRRAPRPRAERARSRLRRGGRPRPRLAAGRCASSMTTTWSATVFDPALPGRSSPESVSPVASANQNMGGTHTRPCRSGRCPPCSRCGSRPTRRRRRGRPGRCRSSPKNVARPRRARWRALRRARTSSCRRDLVEGAPHRRVRGHEPEQVSSWRRYSMSAQLSPPPPAIVAICWTSTLPRSWSGERSSRYGNRDESASPSPTRSAKEQRAWRPTWATTPVPPGSTFTERVLLPFTLEVPFWSGMLLTQHQQFPLLAGCREMRVSCLTA